MNFITDDKHKLIDGIPHKLCTGKHGCREWKAFEEFSKAPRNRDRLNTWCKKCGNVDNIRKRHRKGGLTKDQWKEKNHAQHFKMIAGVENKKCNDKGCGSWKPLLDFSKRKDDTYNFICKECDRKRALKVRRSQGMKPIGPTTYLKREQNKLISDVEHKLCHTIKGGGCQKWKTLDQFNKDPRPKDGLRGTCKKCEYEREKQRIANDINFHFRKRLRGRLIQALKGNSKRAPIMNLVGCTMPEFRQHLKEKWEPWMNWGNYGQFGWVIDHKKPLKSFDLSTLEGQMAAMHYTNLQPMHWRKNIIKSDKILEEKIS